MNKKQALEKIEELKKFIEQEDKATIRWVPKWSEHFHWVTHTGVLDYDCWEDSSIDNFQLSQGNVFKTEEEAQVHLNYLKALAVIKEDAEWWVPDWSDSLEIKWFGRYMYYAERITTDYCLTNEIQGVIYFKSEEAIKKSQREHKKEWLTILNVN